MEGERGGRGEDKMRGEREEDQEGEYKLCRAKLLFRLFARIHIPLMVLFRIFILTPCVI